MTINAQLEAASGEAQGLAIALDELGEKVTIKIAHHAPLVRSLAQRSRALADLLTALTLDQDPDQIGAAKQIGKGLSRRAFVFGAAGAAVSGVGAGFWQAVGKDVKEAVDGHVVDAVVSAGERLGDAIDLVQTKYRPSPVDSFTIEALPKELTTQFVRVVADQPAGSGGRREAWLDVTVYDEKLPSDLYKSRRRDPAGEWELLPGRVGTFRADGYELNVENLTQQVLWLHAEGAS